MNRATRWLDRRVACPGPYLALVLSQAEFDRAMRDCKQPLGRPYLSTAQADATTHLLANHRGETIAVVALGLWPKALPLQNFSTGDDFELTRKNRT